MGTAATIKNSRKENDLRVLLKEKDIRVYMFYLISSMTGYRSSDILKLKVKDLSGTHIDLIEQKTGLRRRILIPRELKSEWKEYTKNKKSNDTLFPSRKGGGPLTYVQVYRILKQAAKEVGLKNIATHSGRKSFGYKLYMKTKDMGTVQVMFGHKDIRTTVKYSGLDQEFKDDIMNKAFN